jgi:hypothetical protein
VVLVASKNTAKGATPDVRLATSESAMAPPAERVHAGGGGDVVPAPAI